MISTYDGRLFSDVRPECEKYTKYFASSGSGAALVRKQFKIAPYISYLPHTAVTDLNVG
jgi:hypothetical protein